MSSKPLTILLDNHNDKLAAFVNANFVRLIDYVFIIYSVVFFYSELWMHNFIHGYFSKPPIYGIYLAFAYAIIRIVLEHVYYKNLYKIGFFWWLVGYGILLVCNYGITKVGFGHVREPYLTDIFNQSLTSLGLTFAFLVILLRRDRLDFALKCLFIAVIFGCINNVYDLQLFDENYGSGTELRGSGFYLNPNGSATALVLGSLVLLPNIGRLARSILLVFVMIGVFITLSRAGSAMFFFLFGLAAVRKQLDFRFLLGALLIIGLLVSMMLGRFQQTDTFEELMLKIEYNKGIGERIDQMLNPRKTEVGIRAVVLQEHLKYYLKSPIVGNGLASSKYVEKNHSRSGHSSHVQYMHMLNEYGLLGLLIIFFLPISMLFVNGKIKLFGSWPLFFFIFLVAGIQSHNMFDSYNYLFSYSLLGVINFHYQSREERE